MRALVYLLILLPLCYSHYDTNHPEYALDTVSLHDDNPGVRLLSVQDRQNIRISAYYFLDEFSPTTAAKIKYQLFPAAINYYKAALKVDPVPAPIKISRATASACGDVDPPSQIYGSGIDSDLIIFVRGKVDPTSPITASARACVLMQGTDRPILGTITYNFASDWEKEDELSFEIDLITTMHELAHVLGFAPSLFEHYIDPTTGTTIPYPQKTITVNGVDQNVLMLEPLTTRLRNYFACPTLEGAYLENEGGAGSIGSHFERRVFFNEYMTASEKEDRRITEFTLAALEGTGWYTPNYDMAEPMFWGKGEGCAFLNQTCIDTTTKTARFTEFCSDRTTGGCTFTGGTKAICGTAKIEPDPSADIPPSFNYFGDDAQMSDTYADNCPYYYGVTDARCYDPTAVNSRRINAEYYGTGSMCFSGTLHRTTALSSAAQFCFKPTCIALAPGQYIMYIEAGNSSQVCPSGGSVSVSGYKGEIYCPDVNDYCSTTLLTYCVRGCMGQGTCVNNECVCDEGYGGPGCSFLLGPLPIDTNEKPFLNPLAVYIGLGIIAGTVIVALLVNKADRLRGKGSREDSYRGEFGTFKRPPILYESGKGRQSGGGFPGIKTGTTTQKQPQPQPITSTEALRQEALVYSGGQRQSTTAKIDALAVIRGSKK